IELQTDYCFQGAVALLAGERPIQLKVQIITHTPSGREKVLAEQNIITTNELGVWQYFDLSWRNTRHKNIIVKVLDVEKSGGKVGVGLDQLYFGKCITSADCAAGIEGENMKGWRIRIDTGYLKNISLQT